LRNLHYNQAYNAPTQCKYEFYKRSFVNQCLFNLQFRAARNCKLNKQSCLSVFIRARLLRLLPPRSAEGGYVLVQSVCLSVRRITEKIVNGF